MAETTAAGPPPPPDPRPKLIEARAKLEADLRAHAAKRQLDTQRLAMDLQRTQQEGQLDLHEAQINAERSKTELMAKHMGQIAQLMADQEEYAKTGLQQGKQEAQPPLMLPVTDVRADQPASGLQSQTDIAQQFGDLLSKQGADPSLATGGAGVRQIQGQGPVVGPPLLNIPGMEAPTPGTPSQGSPSITLGNGETYAPPSFVPVTSAQMRSGYDYSSGQRVPVSETQMSTEMRPNVLTPGDVVQARIAQQGLEWQKNRDRIQLSLEDARNRAAIASDLTANFGSHGFAIAGDVYKGNWGAVRTYLEKNNVQSKFDIDASIARMQMTKLQSDMAANGAAIREHDARTRVLLANEDRERQLFTQQQALREQILSGGGLGGGSGLGQYPPYSAGGGMPGGFSTPAGSGGASGPLPGLGGGPDPRNLSNLKTLPLTAFLGGTYTPSPYTVDAEGKVKFDPQAVGTYTKNVYDALAKALPSGKNVDQGAVAANLSGVQALAAGIQGVVVRTGGGKPDSSWAAAAGFSEPSPGRSYDIRPASDVWMVAALALQKTIWQPKPIYENASPEQQKVAGDQLVAWGLAERGDKGELRPVTQGEMVGVSRVFFHGLQKLATNYDTLDHEITGRILDLKEGKASLPPELMEALSTARGPGGRASSTGYSPPPAAEGANPLDEGAPPASAPSAPERPVAAGPGHNARWLEQKIRQFGEAVTNGTVNALDPDSIRAALKYYVATREKPARVVLKAAEMAGINAMDILTAGGRVPAGAGPLVLGAEKIADVLDPEASQAARARAKLAQDIAARRATAQ